MVKDAEFGAGAQLDFRCFEENCAGVISFSLSGASGSSFQAVCPQCHRAYLFDAALREKFRKMLNLILAVREAEDILGDSCVSVSVAGGEVRIPYSLLLTRLNTMITLEHGGRKTDFHLRVEPSSAETFR